MTEEQDQELCDLCSLPTELLLYIFSFLPAKQLTACRRVCHRWKNIIDSLGSSDIFWREFCKKDFSNIYKTARTNARPGLKWFNIYRSLSLWPKLEAACEIRDEFASASRVLDEIYGIKVLRGGTIGVHTRQAIVYYDIETLEKSIRSPIEGEYFSYTEDDHHIILYGSQLHLFVFRKAVYSPIQAENTVFHNIKMYLHKDGKIFYVNLNNEVFVCDLNDTNLTSTLIKQSADSIVSLGYARNNLYVLTIKRNIYRASMLTTDLVFVCSLEPNTNLMETLKSYNLLEQIDWRLFNQWMALLNRTLPTGPLGDIVTLRTYCDMVFVGSVWGVLLIYHMPPDKEFDIYNATPIKSYNFMEREDCPVLSTTCPILEIDIMESEDGHRVVAAMPKKIIILDFAHSFKRSATKAMLPYRELEKAKVIRIEGNLI